MARIVKRAKRMGLILQYTGCPANPAREPGDGFPKSKFEAFCTQVSRNGRTLRNFRHFTNALRTVLSVSSVYQK